MSDTPAFARRELLHQATQDRVKQFIIKHGFQQGDPLPAEAELARTLGISRPSLREAMRSLQTLGVVETRHGAGTFVGRFSFESLTAGLAFQIRIGGEDERRIARDLHELVAIREVLETGLVSRLAGTYTPETLTALYVLTAEMEKLTAEGEMFSAQDWRFHDMLYRHTGNVLLLDLLGSFWGVFDRVRQAIPAPEQLQNTARHHREIVDALAAGDGEAAGCAMATHFSGILRWISERGGDDTLISAEQVKAQTARTGATP